MENKKYIPNPKRDFSNEKLGSLFVKGINYNYSNKMYQKTNKYIVYYDCVCDCGKEFISRQSSLKSGKTSCKTCMNNRKTKENIYELINNEYYKVTASGCDYFYIDKEDYNNVKNYRWYVTKNGVVIGHDYESNINIRLHRFIMSAPKNLVVDHINGDTLNNRRNNLRNCTHLENMKNRKISQSNTSGITGVSFNKMSQKWVAIIQINHKTINLGFYDNKDDAIYTRYEAELFYLKELSRNYNHILGLGIKSHEYKTELELSSNKTNQLSKELNINVYDLDDILNKLNFKLISNNV